MNSSSRNLYKNVGTIVNIISIMHVLIDILYDHSMIRCLE